MVSALPAYRPARRSRPSAVTVAAELMLLGGAVSLGILLIVLHASGADAPGWAMLTSTEAAVWLVMARHTAGGHIFARFYATVLAAMNVLFTIGLFAGQQESTVVVPLVSALFVVNAALAAAIVGMLWTPMAEPFFDVD